jgi:hypothetical protein
LFVFAPPRAPGGANTNKPPGPAARGAAPPDADTAADARHQDVTAEEPNVARAAGPLDVPGVNSIMSRISGVLQAGVQMTAPASPPAAKSK